ncbi:MAG: nitroreductase family protein [Spirochaetaceae bacterium]|nr:nitroreductase family protein [Myxococcales bacterium]MCB9724260.1 nitroreductase family protein [Spirochaetaceae bacterium]HPG28396.1 nitroreductase family protein [Myxococcota bacterium]
MTASNDFFEVVSTTRSVRRRLDLDRPVERAVLERCIDAAVQAPTGLDRESWRFLVLTEAEPKARVAALYRASFEGLAERFRDRLPASLRDAPLPSDRPTYVGLAENLHRMPALVLVCSEGRPSPDDTAMQVAFYGSVLPAAWSLMLALRAEGLGATWTTLLVSEEAAVAEALGIPADVTQTVLLPVAYTKGAVLRPAARKGAAEVTYWNRWGRRT